MQLLAPQSPSTKSAIPVSHANNFDFLRLLLATLVLTAHAYALTGQSESNNPLDIFDALTHDRFFTLSAAAVYSFLVISGFLVTKSLVRSSSLRYYYLKRVLRVFPGLWVMVLCTVLAGYFLSHRPALAYFTDPTTKLYLGNAMLRLFLKITGVFEHNPFPEYVNGSLWTVPYEVAFYLVLSVLFTLRRYPKLMCGVLGGLWLATVMLWLYGRPLADIPGLRLATDQLLLLGAYFLAGAALSFVALPSRRVRRWVASAAAVLLLLCCWLGGYQQAQFILLPVLVLCFATLYTPALAWVGKYGDISYGTYIYGFFIQQVLAQYLVLTPGAMMALSIPLTYVVGAASWHLVEKKALQWKFSALKKPAGG